jgi:predicted AlkP superfamily pyrophosphatase or phosphodiesterase
MTIMRIKPLLTAILFATALMAQTPRHVVLITIDGFAAYNLDDDSIVMPNIRALRDAGVRTAGSETIFPSLTHPSHTTIVTGVAPIKHGVLANTMHDRIKGTSYRPTNLLRSESVRVPTIFDVAKKRGMTTASFFWPETRGDASIDYNIPELLEDDRTEIKQSIESPFASELRKSGLPMEWFEHYYDDPALQDVSDLILAEAAAETIRKHKPDLLAIHFLATDKAQHVYGPGHYLSNAAITQTDRRIGILRDAVKTAGLEKSTTWVIAADHGFQTVSEEINLDPILRKDGLTGHLAIDQDKWVMHIARAKSFDQATDGPHLQSALATIAALPGIERVIASKDFPSLGFPRYEDDIHVTGEYMVIANINYHLVLDPASNSVAPRPKKKPYSGHGYPPTHPRMYPALVLSGSGIQIGKQIGHVHNIDIAPTIADLLGLEMAGVDGRVLKEALRPD